MKESEGLIHPLLIFSSRNVRGKGIFEFLCTSLLFLYFLTLSAELLHLEIYLFKPKLNHIFAVLLLGLVVCLRSVYIIPRKVALSLSVIFLAQSISACFSPCFSRCLGYVGVNAVTVMLFFFLPIQLIALFGRHRILKIYFASFLCIGSHAGLQFILSFFGFEDPFVRQKMLGFIARGQSMTYEPSYYALYAIAPVMYYNTKRILEKKKNLFPFLLVNFLLIASTSTGAFFGYCFFLSIFPFFACGRWIRPYIQGFMKRFLKIGIVFSGLFLGFALCFQELFLQTFYKFFYFGFFLHDSFLERWESIINAWNIFCEHPCFGVGLGGIGPTVYLRENFLYEKTALVNPSIEMLALLDPKNVFFELLGSLGLFGLLAFGIFGCLIYSIFRNALSRSDLLLEDRIVIFSLFLSLFVMVFCLQFNQGLFRNYVWLHMALGVGYVLSLNAESVNGENRF